MSVCGSDELERVVTAWRLDHLLRRSWLQSDLLRFNLIPLRPQLQDLLQILLLLLLEFKLLLEFDPVGCLLQILVECRADRPVLLHYFVDRAFVCSWSEVLERKSHVLRLIRYWDHFVFLFFRTTSRFRLVEARSTIDSLDASCGVRVCE